ncbi:MAG: hypothetical protein AAF721_18780 [Myxococcota bacterium]
MTKQAATILMVVAVGCGDDGGRGPSTTIDPSGVSVGDGGTGDDGSASTAGDDDGAGSGSAADDAPPDDNGDETPDDDGMIWDVGSNGGEGCGEGNAGDLSYSYLWVANSPQGTMSKINTETLVEEGRYYVRPDSGGSPSRTSVGLSGDVAVAARSGGMSKFYANAAECGAGETSTGKEDVKPFPDPCLAWHTPFNYSSHRGVAWAPAEWDEASCSYINEKLWSAGVSSGTVEVALLDGETGTVEDSVQVPEAGGGVGVYGAAVDSAGNFWGWVPSGSRLLKVDRATLVATTWQTPSGGYGITVDHKDRPWLCSGQATRFDPVTEMFQSTSSSGGGGTGCMEDGQGTLWIGTGNGISGIDIDSVTAAGHLDAPGFIKGVSIQEDGAGKIFVWGVTMSQDAYKIDPMTNTYETFTGLNSPYTYSDMTGFALGNVVGDPSG